MRPLAYLLALGACAGEWKQRQSPMAVSPPTCEQAKTRAREQSTGPLITGYVMIGAGAAAGAAAVISAVRVSSMRAQTDGTYLEGEPSYVPTVVISAVAAALLAVGGPLSYQGYASRFDAPTECTAEKIAIRK